MGLAKSVLVANRGEIARRIMRTARRLEMRTVAVYSEADAGAAHVREADAAVLIGPAPARESYLVAERILQAACDTGAEAIHPGYGFLSENALFAEQVTAAGFIWVGPPPSAIRAMGLKDAAKRLMRQAGVPVTPGYLGEDQSPQRLALEAEAIGWPVLIKAVAGGGGKGMRRVDRAEDFAAALSAAKREGASSFGDDRVLLEKCIVQPRHIEVQLFGDSHGHVVHLFERDCSLQRRHQKVIEEAPAPGMDEATRTALCATAVRAGEAVGYQGAGTVEFIADVADGLRADRIWFMEMNTRLQVEHPVTEAITGLDLVEWQFRVACAEPLPLVQSQISMHGHAIEARLYAEDPGSGFLPSTGQLTHFVLPTDARIDSGFERGDVLTPFYDPMIAKLIVHRETREAAAAALAKTCAGIEVWPVKTNAGFLARCADHPDFVAGSIDTSFIEQHLEALISEASPVVPASAGAALSRDRDGDASPWSAVRGAMGFRLNASSALTSWVYIDGRPRQVALDFTGSTQFTIDPNRDVIFFAEGYAHTLSAQPPEALAATAVGDGMIRAPMPGRVAKLAVGAGDSVTAGQTMVVLEAMKMEHALTAPFDGVVVETSIAEGAQVTEGTVLARLEPGT